ncbi:GDSL-type esterase/lipase family protein [Gimesia aquarii]|uniref:Alpha/beta hydrolase family protein n=1 Tax=Gimesia aquarii TaxID=2527964 RepID=A0A517X161_9PLAN|nr:GDSL-type esterase/lipase family protein [Gimesia aquarii]QDU11241.1 hypothetical protein V202x_46600 [Gimesia aquarii]
MKSRHRFFPFFFNTALLLILTSPEYEVYASSIATGKSEWEGRQDVWHGFKRFHFQLDNRKCYVVVPTQTAFRKPWIWRARFPDFHYEMDVELLRQGFHIAYIDVANLFGSPQAIEYGNKFYQYLTKQHGFQQKVALEGVSRGGLFIYNWAVVNPEKVSCIYADTPVCDFKSWPGGKGKSEGSKASWKACLKAYGLTEAEALLYKNNPIDQIQTIAKARIPVLHIVSENDQVVPPDENTYLMFRRIPESDRKHNFKVLSVKTGTKKSKGHHFQHPYPNRVVSFIVKNTVYEGGSINEKTTRTLKQIKKINQTIPPINYMPNPRRLKHLKQTRHKITRGGNLRVVMLGDSIVNDTSRSQWHLLIEEKYPACKITKITSVRGSTGCWWYQENQRVQLYVTEQNPDLVIIGGISHRNDIDAIQSVVRQIREQSNAEILLTTGAFGRVDPHNDQQWQLSIDQEKTPYRYQLQQLAQNQNCGFLDLRAHWGQYIRNSDKNVDWFQRDPVHANDKGEQILGNILARYLAP